MSELLNRIHESYNPGVTEMYVFVPIVLITAVALYFMTRKDH